MNEISNINDHNELINCLLMSKIKFRYAGYIKATHVYIYIYILSLYYIEDY